MNNEKKSLYKEALMDHYKNPRNKQQGPFPNDMLSARGSIPRCGDDIDVGVRIEPCDAAAYISDVAFRGRGCSVCLASASMMTESLQNLSLEEAIGLTEALQDWIDNKLEDDSIIPEALKPLGAVKDHSARKKCVMLAWNAAKSAIQLRKENAA